MNAHIRTCKRLCEDAGLVVLDVKCGKHLKLKVAKGNSHKMVIFSASPSDSRWQRNQQAFIKRLSREIGQEYQP